MESMKEYVVRKLNEKAVNISALSKALGMNRSKVYRVKNNGETSASTLISLNDYFRKLGE